MLEEAQNLNKIVIVHNYEGLLEKEREIEEMHTKHQDMRWEQEDLNKFVR